MDFIETSVFTRQVMKLLTDEEYRQLQMTLILKPDKGIIIQGGGGVRKIRWPISGHGKRGGVRVIYYWVVKQDKILMLLMYSKNDQDDLSPSQIKILRRIVEEEFL